MVVVKVVDEDGSEGIGYSDLLAEFIRRVITRFVGKDAMKYEAIWDELFQGLTRWGRRALGFMPLVVLTSLFRTY